MLYVSVSTLFVLTLSHSHSVGSLFSCYVVGGSVGDNNNGVSDGRHGVFLCVELFNDGGGLGNGRGFFHSFCLVGLLLKHRLIHPQH